MFSRRHFLKAATGAGLSGASRAWAAPKLKITRIRVYSPPRPNPTFNQATLVVAVETDGGITGIGEGGSKEMLEQCAAMLVGENPWYTERLWQLMYRGFFYPPGREKLHALGALDMALWDIKGKALGLPVRELLGGLCRDHLECYSGGMGKPTIRENAQAVMEAGFRAYRLAVVEYLKSERGGLTERGFRRAGPNTGIGVTHFDSLFKSSAVLKKVYEYCKEAREGVGEEGDWCIDYHTRLDPPDAVYLTSMISGLRPFFVEDPIRSEATDVYQMLRPQLRVPLAVGEQFGARWDMHKLIEQNLIDYVRATIPNVGGITEWMKISALSETHYVGLIPHGTGPVSTAALIHACGVFSGPVLLELGGKREAPYLPESFEFHDGKAWPNSRPGLGVAFDPKHAHMIAEIDKPSKPIPLYHRPDGSLTNW
jgi:L-alanine-DL-glutamate epimerase-like enolase superfamily enzyme